ncbi:hypothetical protein DRQ32_04605 [bacterium]|nr:MAG: hypothetical protein DRQ32_04605 [bacterium]
MSVALSLAILLLVTLLVDGMRKRGQSPARGPDPIDQITATGRRLYTRRNFIKLLGATAGASVITYSGLDEALHELHRDQVRGTGSNRIAHVAKGFGETEITAFPVIYILADWALPGTAVGRWGRQCFTATATGLPVLWSWQRALGASRPSDDKEWGPRYRPFNDENSVSGHCFLGAIPFLVAAHEMGHPIAAWSMRALSPLTGWSRLNDERHYLSQVLLGYLLALEATRAADLSPAVTALPTSREDAPEAA